MEGLLAIGELLLFGVTAHVGFRFQREQLQLQRLIAFLQKAEVLAPAQAIRALAVSDASASDLKDVVEGAGFVKGTALFRGVVGSDYSLSSVLDSTLRLVVSELSLEQMLSNSQVYEEVEGKKQVFKAHEFYLADPQAPEARVTVDNGNRMRCYQDALSLIKTEEHSRSLTAGERLISWVMFSIKLFLSVNNFGKKASGFSIGIRRLERGILVGQLVTVFGEFVFDRFSKQLRVTNPRCFTQSKEQLLHRLQDADAARSRNLALVFGLLVLVASSLARRLFRLARLAAGRLQQMRALRDNAFARLARLEVSGVTCVACGSQPRGVIFRPCLHLAVCWHCEAKLEDRRCPLCRAPVESALHVFSG